MRHLLIFAVVFSSFSAVAQGDFILLRENNAVVKSYFKGSYFTGQLNNGKWVEGRVMKIKDDSLFMEQMEVRQVASIFGTPMLDTVKYGILKLSIKDIHALPRKEKGITVVNNGSLFMLGAAGYMVLNVVNGLTQTNQAITSHQNIINLSIAAGVFMFGEILHWTHHKYIIIGKKYQLYSTATVPAK